MPAGTYKIDTFKGLNRLGSRFNMQPYWVWDLLNGYVKKTDDGKGSIQQRHGVVAMNTTVLNDSSTKIRYLFEAKWDSGGKDIIARAYDGWYRYEGRSFRNLDIGRDIDAKGFACMFQNNMIMVDGGTPRIVDKGYTVSDLSTDSAMPTDSTAVWLHEHRVWLNSKSNPMKVYGSRVDNATADDAFSAASDAITLDLSQVLPTGDEVIGFRTMGDNVLVILLRQHIVVYFAPTVQTDISLQQVIGVGSLSNYSLAQIGNDWVYPTSAGVNSLKSSATYQKLDIDDLTKRIPPMYRDLLKRVSDKQAVCGAYYHNLNHYYLTLPTSGGFETLVYSIDFKNFVGRYTFNDIDPYSWLETEDGTLYMGGDNGKFYSFDPATSSDDGNAITFQWALPYLGIETPDRFKAMRQIEMLVETNKDVSLKFDYEFGLGGGTTSEGVSITGSFSLWRVALWRVALWRGTGRQLFKSFDLTGRGQLIGITVWHNTVNAIVNIPYFILRTVLEGNK